ncbi:prephenate dehydratase [Shewanella yunxiaonensis]|uniref:Prephenate dehydratase n=1 Tax=Shewanella yunxiaonensis TaxID=2829809 RepID=A0ABX7YR96_9GAMM|nr:MULTISPECIES: prephenate dehydratase [Shewanella]MDF0533718.1 prephenate dehydratase [Shewanella sp. A32]QUN04925.1 prephenate dehydratase [Shewanella yunxiaonensis]
MKKAPQLNLVREQITSVDKSLLELLAKRRQLSLEVARSKEIDIRPIRDTKREKELLADLVKQGREHGLDAHYVLSLYQSIIEDSVLNQQAYLQSQADFAGRKLLYNIAYLGARGSYSYIAAHRYCERRDMEMQDMGCHSFGEIIRAVESGHADYGFLPIENTSSGSINEVYDLLQHTNLSIVAETTIEVGHCLLAKPNSSLEHIKTVYAHPQPISQCSRYLNEHPNIKLHYCASSAEAMELVSKGDNTVAAIGSAEGGAYYNLEVLDQNLANQKINQSRFIVVARKAVSVPTQIPAKTTLIMTTGQTPGSLADALLVLKLHNLNITKLESRPIYGTPWEEMFYLDIDGNTAHRHVRQALHEMERITRFIKVLGCYSSENVKPTQLENSQLLIEPDSSKNALPQEADSARYSRSFKEHNTEVVSGELHIGNGALAAITSLNVTTLGNSYSQQAQALREAGFQAVIVDGISQVNNDVLSHFRNQLNNLGLQCIISVQQQADLLFAKSHADLLLIPGEQMFNKELLSQLGAMNMPVILERNNMASEQDWLSAADSLLSCGNQQLILCEAGIRSFSHPEQLTLDLAALVNIKSISHLPMIINLSYINADLQPQLAQAAEHLHADGIVLPAGNLKEQRQLLAEIYRQHSQP